jgi:hypothetical protein
MTPTERKAVKAGKKQRIQKLLKGLANIRPEPVKLEREPGDWHRPAHVNFNRFSTANDLLYAPKLVRSSEPSKDHARW